MGLSTRQHKAVTVTKASRIGTSRACFVLMPVRPGWGMRPRLLNLGRVLWTSQVIDFIEEIPIRPRRPRHLFSCMCACLRTRAQGQAQGRTHACATRYHEHFGRIERKLMKSTTYAVQHAVQQTETLDGLDVLLPMPTSIKEQMPVIAEYLQQLAANMDRDFVGVTVKASIDLRRAYDADDFAAVSAVYARKNGWITCEEGGFQLGVPDAHMAAFAQRHRRPV